MELQNLTSKWNLCMVNDIHICLYLHKRILHDVVSLYAIYYYKNIKYFITYFMSYHSIYCIFLKDFESCDWIKCLLFLYSSLNLNV